MKKLFVLISLVLSIHGLNAQTGVKIPITADRWYQLSNASGLDQLFDGVLNVDVNTGYGKLITNFDAFYRLQPGEAMSISSIKFYNYQGSIASTPFTLSIINNAGVRKQIASYVGGKYQTWIGPYPTRTVGGNAFALDSTITDIKYLVINSSSLYPNEMELWGSYTPPTPLPALTKKSYPLSQYFGVNAFEWDFEDPNNPLVIDETRMKAVKAFTAVRHYMDWDKLEHTQGSFSFNPTIMGGWNYDTMYQRCKAEGIEVLADLKCQPAWMVSTYASANQDIENVPVLFGKDFTNPNSYLEQAKIAFRYAARYGSNPNVDKTLLSVNTTPRWGGDVVNQVKVGMNVIKYIECDNERDKWWKARKAYQTSYEYAANLSAFYDGNKNTMGPGVGVKNADPNMKVVMGGLADPQAGYLRGMIEWCRINRGYNPDGSINLCWDVINYHMYSTDLGTSQGNSNSGAAPELAGNVQTAASFIQLSHELAKDIPVWVTELGYDYSQQSPFHAYPIGTKSTLQVEADWDLRSSLLFARAGIERSFFFEMYDDNAANPGAFGTSGMINTDKTRRPSADFLYQTNRLLGKYSYKETLNSDPIVDHYDLNGNPAYALMIPDQKGRTANYTLDLGSADSARIYTPKVGADSMSVNKVSTVSGKVVINVTETPVFVIPFGQKLQTLPVGFVSISATKVNTNAAINWTVADPLNYKTFTIQRSTNGVDFTDIATVSGGSSSSYVYNDTKPIQGINYYRVKGNTQTGQSLSSSVVTVNFSTAPTPTPSNSKIYVYPNPVSTSQIHVNFVNEVAGNYAIALYNAAGNSVYQGQIYHAAGPYGDYYIPVATTIANGIYQLTTTSPTNQVLSMQVVLSRR